MATAAVDTFNGRRGTAATLRALDAVAGGGFYEIPTEAETDADAADAAFAATGPVIDVQTHLVDPARWHGDGAAALAGFLRSVDRERWADAIDPASARRRGLGDPRVRVERDRDRARHVDAGQRRPQRAAEPADRGDARAGRPLRRFRARAYPRHRPSQRRTGRARPDGRRVRACSDRRVGSATRSTDRRPRRRRRAAGSSTTTRSVSRSSSVSGRRARRVVAVHKGLGGPIPSASVAAASPRDVGPGRGGVSRRDLPRVPLRVRAGSRRRGGSVQPGRTGGRRPAGHEPRRRGDRSGRERVRGARNDVVPDVAPPGRSRARAGEAAARGGARPHRVGDRLHLVRLAAAAHRRVPHVPDPRVDAGNVRLPAADGRDEGEDPRRERARRLRHQRRRRRACASPIATRDWVATLAPTIADAITRAGRP